MYKPTGKQKYRSHKTVYMIKNLITGNAYVGLSWNVKRRIYGHFAMLKMGIYNSDSFLKEYQQYGKASFVYGEIATVPTKTRRINRFAAVTESYFIAKYGTYNKQLIRRLYDAAIENEQLILKTIA